MKPWTQGKIKFMSALMLLLADLLENKYNLLDNFAIVNVFLQNQSFTAAEYYNSGIIKIFNQNDY